MTVKTVCQIGDEYLEKHHIDCYTWNTTWVKGHIRNLVYYEKDGMVKGKRHLIPWEKVRAEVVG